MSCCDESIPISEEYVPLNKRLIEYGEEVYGKNVMEKFNITKMWIFTFYENDELCIECEEKFAEMAQWFAKYGLLEDPIKNVKWLVDDEIKNNLILKDLHISKTPVHFFCNSDGNIIDIIFGFPSPQWLEKHILPLVNSSKIF